MHAPWQEEELKDAVILIYANKQVSLLQTKICCVDSFGKRHDEPYSILRYTFNFSSTFCAIDTLAQRADLKSHFGSRFIPLVRPGY
jgi:hypothetical protein